MAFFTNDQINALSAGVVRTDLLTKMEFRDSTVYLWNGNTDLVVAGQAWKPTYGAGTIEGLSYSGNEQSEAVTFQLTGLSTELLADALEDTPQVAQQMVTIYLQLFNGEWQPVGSPVAVWWGFMQPPKVTRSTIDGAEGATQVITMSAENAFFNRSRPPQGRLTDREQRARSPDDGFAKFIPTLKFKSLNYPLFGL
jgi:hypothetical protein